LEKIEEKVEKVEEPEKSEKTPEVEIKNEEEKTDGMDVEEELVAVVLTTFLSSSYDAMFREVRQNSGEGTKVNVYAIIPTYLKFLQEALEAAN